MATRTKSQPKPASSSPGVDLTEIERLLGFMDKHGLEEFLPDERAATRAETPS